MPLYLLELGFGPLQVGILATATLCGSGLLTLAVGLRAHRYHARALLLSAAALMTATGLAFAAVHDFWPLLIVAIVGTLNPSSGDVSVFLPIEHAVLSQAAGDRERTAAFARYSLVGALVAAFGSLAAAFPPTLAQTARDFAACRAAGDVRVVRGAGRAGGARVPRPARSRSASTRRRRIAPLRESKRRIYALAALFSLDAFGGGFVVQSLVALWLYQRFGLSLAAVGALFFWTSMLSALSYLVAVRIAHRIGLVNTMVFTHLPSSLCLIAIPFMQDANAGHRAAARQERAVADGRADAQLVRDGDRDTRPSARRRPA